MILASASVITFVPRFWRIYLALWLMRRWRLPATPALSLPVAVSLKRFFAPDLVFSFGISRRNLPAPSSGVLMSRPGMPLARRLRRGGSLRQKGRRGKPQRIQLWGWTSRSGQREANAKLELVPGRRLECVWPSGAHLGGKSPCSGQEQSRHGPIAGKGAVPVGTDGRETLECLTLFGG